MDNKPDITALSGKAYTEEADRIESISVEVVDLLKKRDLTVHQAEATLDSARSLILNTTKIF